MSTTTTPADPPPPRPFAVGDRVTFMVSSKTRSGGWTFSTKHGVIESLKAQGATLRLGNNKRTFEFLRDLRHADEKNAVTQIFEIIAGQPIGGGR